MITKTMFTLAVGGALLSGAAVFAQQEEPQAQGQDAAVERPMPPSGAPVAGGFAGCCGSGAGPGGIGPIRPHGGGFGAAGMGQGRGREAMFGPQMMRPCGFGREGAPDEGVTPELAKQAGATDQQIEALKAFTYEQEAKRIDLKASVEKADLVLKHVMQGEAPDEKAAVQAADALSAARGELFRQEVASRVKVREILGEAVMKKLRERPSAGAFGPRGGGCCPKASCPRTAQPQPRPAPAGAEQGGNPPHTQDN